MLRQRLQQLHDERKVVVLPPNVFDLPMKRSEYEVCVVPPDIPEVAESHLISFKLLVFLLDEKLVLCDL